MDNENISINKKETAMRSKPEKQSQHAIRFILLFYMLCLAARLLEIFVFRTDQGIFGEAFIHKLFGIAAMGVALYALGMKWRDIGFALTKIPRGLLVGALLGGVAFALAYGIEFLIQSLNGSAPSLRFYATSYNVIGNTALSSAGVFILIVIAGNIINVVMEDGVFRGLFMRLGESRFSFPKAMLFSSILFGFWHGIMPIRNFLDGNQSGAGAAMSVLLLVITSFIFGVELCLLTKLEGSLWAGMTVHFINNASVNLLHVVSSSGTDVMQTMRIAIAQTIIFIIVAVLYVKKSKKRSSDRKG
jgi:membrane protease YdiL (CAAX protease family)